MSARKNNASAEISFPDGLFTNIDFTLHRSFLNIRILFRTLLLFRTGFLSVCPFFLTSNMALSPQILFFYRFFA